MTGGLSSTRAVHDDDMLLDRLAARLEVDSSDDPAVGLLAALAHDVDRGLPARQPRLRVVPDLADRRGRVLSVGRKGAVAAAVAMVFASAGVAAAVTGDPKGAFGLTALSRLLDGDDPTPPPTVARPSDPGSVGSVTSPGASSELAAMRLRELIAAAAARPGGPDRAELERLRALARSLPDGGGDEVRRELTALAKLVGADAATSVPTASGSGSGSGSGPGSGGESADPKGSPSEPQATPGRPSPSASTSPARSACSPRPTVKVTGQRPTSQPVPEPSEAATAATAQPGAGPGKGGRSRRPAPPTSPSGGGSPNDRPGTPSDPTGTPVAGSGAATSGGSSSAPSSSAGSPADATSTSGSSEPGLK